MKTCPYCGELVGEDVNDRTNGSVNADGIRATLSRYAADGWRLHSAVSNLHSALR